MPRILTVFGFVLLLAINPLAHAETALPIVDDFSKTDLPFRVLGRGEWKVVDGMTVCTQDDALYKKHKDHGPMITYRVPFKDAKIQLAFRPDSEVKTAVFTINNAEGHVFRIVATDKVARALMFNSADHKSKPLATDLPKMVVGDWNLLEFDARGTSLSIKLGDYAKSFELNELDVEKTNVTIGFSFGTMAVRDVKITP
jgi:hypothetical protein